jgi:hypothetical protein
LQVFAAIQFETTKGINKRVGDTEASARSREVKIPLKLLKKISLAQSSLQSAIEKLSFKDLLIYHDLIGKQRFETKRELQFMKRLLAKVKEEGLVLMHFLTTLSTNEITSLTMTASRPTVVPGATDTEQEDQGSEFKRKYYIDNAGLCLIAGYLPALLKRLGLTENKLFKDKAAACRAVLLLQYVVSGKAKHPEFVLQLNKLLCGIHPENLSLINLRLTRKEKAEADEMIKAVINNWKALKATSVNGFRESFLQRNGILTDNETHWSLQVERKGFDILLNTIPWGFGIIKLPWMKKHIQVEW